MRYAERKRKTQETDIALSFCIDGDGKADVSCGCGFLEHMLTLFAKHGGFNLAVTCKGDTHVDYHHTVEDIAIVLGEAFCEALGDKRGIVRYGDTTLPMDETLVLSAADISGRGGAYLDIPMPTQRVGDFDTELCAEFFYAFARTAGITLHIQLLRGENSHHIIEGVFKSVAHTLRKAAATDERFANAIPSTKGTLI